MPKNCFLLLLRKRKERLGRLWVWNPMLRPLETLGRGIIIAIITIIYYLLSISLLLLLLNNLYIGTKQYLGFFFKLLFFP